MRYREFGAGDPTILLLHGGGLNWWNYREAAEALAPDFHVILPILDGHAGSDRHFTTIENNAAAIVGFIDERFGGTVDMIGGLSLGGQVLLEMLAQRPDLCRSALIESAAAVPSPLTRAMIRPAFGSSYGLIRQRWFSRLQFRSLRMKPELFEDYYRDTCGIEKRDLIAFMEANTAYALKPSLGNTRARVFVCAGGKENRLIRRSVEVIAGAIPGCDVRILPGLRHGEFSINRAAEYADEVRKIVAAADKAGQRKPRPETP